MVPRTFRGNHLHSFMPSIGFVVRHKIIRIGVQQRKAYVKCRNTAFFIPCQPLDSTPWAISRGALVISKLSLSKQVVAAHISAGYLSIEKQPLVNQAMLS